MNPFPSKQKQSDGAFYHIDIHGFIAFMTGLDRKNQWEKFRFDPPMESAFLGGNIKFNQNQFKGEAVANTILTGAHVQHNCEIDLDQTKLGSIRSRSRDPNHNRLPTIF
jgi:hypothetical protein